MWWVRWRAPDHSYSTWGPPEVEWVKSAGGHRAVFGAYYLGAFVVDEIGDLPEYVSDRQYLGVFIAQYMQQIHGKLMRIDPFRLQGRPAADIRVHTSTSELLLRVVLDDERILMASASMGTSVDEETLAAAEAFTRSLRFEMAPT